MKKFVNFEFSIYGEHVHTRRRRCPEGKGHFWDCLPDWKALLDIRFYFAGWVKGLNVLDRS